MTERVRALRRTLSDDVVSIRPFEVGDGEALIAGRDSESYRFLGEGTPDPHPIACIAVGTTIVGWIDYDHERAWLATDEVNVGYNVFPKYRRYGYGTRALRLFQGYLESLDPPLRATLLVDPENAGSLALAAAAGFRVVAKFDDQLFMKHETHEV